MVKKNNCLIAKPIRFLFLLLIDLSLLVGCAGGGDTAFPPLSNLEPNGNVPGFGVLDEQYVRLEYSPSDVVYLEVGKAYESSGVSLTEVEGISYNAPTNTVVLDNFTGNCTLDICLMGNGLKLELNGSNSLDHLLVWGFGYGGSLTITGTGKLIVNPNDTNSYGIYLRGEQSQTCLMIDKTVQIESYGLAAAVLIEDTTMEKGIYFLEPLTVVGGEQVTLSSKNQSCHCYSFNDLNTGKLSTHIQIQ